MLEVDMLKRIGLIVLSSIFVSGCNSLEIKPLIQNAATTTVAYALGGPVPALANATVMVTTEEMIAEDTKVGDIETEEQAVAYVAESLFMNALYAFIAYLLITLIAVPFIKRWGYNQAKDKYKAQVRVSQEIIDKIKNDN